MARPRTDTQAVVNLVINGQQSQASLKQLNDTARRLRTEFNNMSEASNPAQYARLRDELKRVNEVIRDTTNSTRAASDELTGFQKVMAGVFGGNMLERAWDLAAQGVVGFITKNAELSDQMAGVIKTTGLNEAAVDRLNEKFKDLNQFDTRTARSELLALAQVAGKLGFSSERDVEGFVRAADKIGVALGEDLGGTEDAVQSIGKLIDIFKVNEDFTLEDSILKVGSAINELGASGTANEKYLIDFTQRMAGIAPAANISMTDVMGLGATLDELGQQVEASSTAVGQFIVGMGKDIPKFAKIAKMEVADFAKLLKEDANEAFLRILENSKSAGGGIKELAQNMGILDVEGARALTSIGVLADNTDKLRAKQDVASKSFSEGTSILNEFNNVNNNLAANLEKIQNKISSVWENSKLRQALTDLTAMILGTNSEADKLTRSFEAQKAAVKDLEANTYPLIARYDQLKFQGKLNKEEQTELHDIIQQLALVVPDAVTEWNKYGDAMDINRDKVSKFTTAQRELLQLRNKDAISDLQELFKRSTKDAEIYQKRMNSTLNQKEDEEGWFGVKDVQRFGDQAKLSMGDAADAAKRLRDEFGVKLTPAQQAVIDHFEKQTKVTKDNKKVTSENTEEVAKSVTNLETLEAKLASLIDERKKAPEGSKELARINREIVDTERRIDAIKQSYSKSKSGGKTGISDAKKAAEEYKKLLAEFDALDAKRLIDQLSKNEKEQAELAKTYDDEIKKYQEFLTKKGVSDEQRLAITNKIIELEANKFKAGKELQLRQESEYVQKISDLRTSLGNRHETELQKERDRINKFYDDLIKENSGNEERVTALNKDRAKDLADADVREAERAAKEKAQIVADGERLGEFTDQKRLLEINKRYDAEVQALREKFSKEFQLTAEFHALMAELEKNRKAEIETTEKDIEKTKREALLQATQEVSNAVFSIMSNNRKAETDAAIAEINKQREAELSNKNLTEAQKKQINAKYDAKEKAEKRKAWAAQKRADLAQAVINMALGITRALASSPPPANWINAAAVGVASTAQIAVIASQKAPQFAKGGLLPYGPSHASGGIALINPQGKKVGEIEGGEPIISKETYRNNPEIVDKLLYSSMRKNGARILNPDVREATLNGRSGGSVMNQPAPVVNVTAPAPDFSPLKDTMEAMVAAFNNAQDKQVIFSFKQFEEETAKTVQIRNNVNA